MEFFRQFNDKNKIGEDWGGVKKNFNSLRIRQGKIIYATLSYQNCSTTEKKS